MKTRACNSRDLAVVVSSLFGVFAVTPWAAFAQTGERSARLEEVVVSARYREESLQDVPDSIVALSGTELEQKNITDLRDLAISIPNMGVGQALHPGSLFINMRGINTFRGSEPGVSVIIDGVQASSAEQLSQELFDIERLEILKGPQGALYGRNALVGAINIVTRKPTNEMENRIKAGYANGDEFTVSATSSGSIVRDKLFYSLSGSFVDFNGTIRNDFLNAPVDFRESETVRGRLVWTPAERLEVDARITYDDLHAGAYYFAAVVDDDFRPVRDAADRFDFPLLGDVLTTADREFLEAAVNVVYEPNFGGELKYFFAYHNLEETYGLPGTGKGGFVDRAGNLDNLQFPVLANAQLFDRKTISNEIRYLSDPTSDFRYVVGAQYVRQDQEDQLPVFAALGNLEQWEANIANGDPLVQGLTQDENMILLPGGADTERTIEALGIYANVNWDLTPDVELTLAYRYDEDERERLDNNTGGKGSKTFREHQPKASLAWSLSDGKMVYATVSKGFRSGGFNKILDPNDPTDFALQFESETLWNYEIGAKSTWLDNRLKVNLAAFYQDVENHQEFAFQPIAAGQIVYNIPKMEIYGLEIETDFVMGYGLNMGVTVGLLDSEIKEFDSLDAGFASPIDAVGNQAPGVEHWKYTAFAEYTYSIGSGELIGRVDFTQGGDLQWFIDGLNKAPSREMLQAKLTFLTGDWEFSVWGENLLDEEWWSSYEPSTQTGLAMDLAYPQAGRRYGIDASFRF